MDKSYLTKINIINFFISLIPLSIIIGNLAININIMIISLFGLIIYKKNTFFIEKKIYQYLIYLFFFVLIITTIINNINNFELNKLYKQNFFKSLSYLRFLLLFLIITKLIENNKLNIKLFFISSAFFSLLLAIDIIIQVIFGTNLLGYDLTFGKASGFFGEEIIAGGYLQKFLLFLIFFIILEKKGTKNNFLILLLFIIFLIPIFLTGNRMPILLYVSSIIIYFVIHVKFKEIFIFLIFMFSLLFVAIKFPFLSRMDTQIKVFASEALIIMKNAPRLFYYDNYENDEIRDSPTNYLIHFNSGIQIWKKNKILGNGLKSMPLKCEYGNYRTCNSHPHNYFIEILSDTGILGLALIYFIIILSLIKYYEFFKFNYNKKVRFISFPFFFVLIMEFFPLRSTGSFFTTNNSIIIFLFLAIFLNSEKLSSSYKEHIFKN